MKVVAFRVQAGDDASCLNLYQPLRPRLLGVPVDVHRAATRRIPVSPRRTAQHRQRTHQSLDAACCRRIRSARVRREEHRRMDAQVQDWAARITLPPDRPFASTACSATAFSRAVCLCPRPNFLRMYPGHEGYNFFLIQTPEGKEETGAARAGTGLRPIAVCR